MDTFKNLAKSFLGKIQPQQEERDPVEQQLLDEIREVCRQMRTANARFSLESDDDLVESCIFEMEALQARYRYLYKCAREKGLSCAPYGGQEAIREGRDVG